MAKLVVIRHGQSEANRDNVFTGWSDVPLTDLGYNQAHEAGAKISKLHIPFADVHTSYLKRAIITANIIMDEVGQNYVPIHKTWRLNERHYGALRGRNKAEVEKKVGSQQLKIWRRSYSVVPPMLAKADVERRYQRIGVKIPRAESLEMTWQRMLPYWIDQIAPALLAGKNQLVVAHGSTLRALIKYLDNISDENITEVEVPNGKPIVYEFDGKLNILNKKTIG
ncbi:2,3-bisphosphoglycerate-dependent phosphoglycerate mutase [Lentilactobacillus sp. SPB1-3]|uniref:2,3-diphosphoglycerate-dependent phosphoglycerate mutase n=1 Tax=Lentilactobacillus terminaliae TaxID=3003483 RepID=A0ACD5DG80_9LACO|nr:2,3-bisphosphoglycerate-dependent phosphoglycerate mutase [Lentilactobacillus sp. SPB1-3]MCZ0976879.1 2,3-bisphosphoglycerate-dependent phosphoglycerate mutase [Lentilactobacillus sp. SPB1-3]